MASVGPKTDTEAMATRREITGTATDEAPSKDSPCDTAYPTLRTDSRQRTQSASVRTVLLTRGGKPARRRARSASGFQAAIALPLLVVCDGQAPAEVAEEAHAVGVLDALDEDDVGAVGHREVDGQAGADGHLAQGRQGHVAQLVAGQGQRAELVDVDAEAVLPAVGVLLDEAAAGEGLQQPVRGGLGDPEPAGDVGDPQLAVEGEALEHVEGAADRLQPGAVEVVALRALGGRGAPRLLLEDDRHVCGSLARWVDGLTVRPSSWFDQRMRSTERNTAPCEPALTGRRRSSAPSTSATPVLSLVELSRRTGLPKSTVHRIAAELVDPAGAGAPGVGPSGDGYRLGMWLFERGELVPEHRSLSDAALPLMEDLREVTRQRIHLAVLEGVDVVYVEILGTGGIDVASRTGGRLPGARDRGGEGDPRVLAGRHRAGPDRRRAAPADAAHDLHARGADPRAAQDPLGRAWPWTSRSRTLGVSCVAAPVFGADRKVAAALSVTGATGVDRPGHPGPGGAHRRVHPEPAAARVRPLSTAPSASPGADGVAAATARSSPRTRGGAQRLIRGERTPPVALSPSLKKSSRWMSRGKSRLPIRVFSAASTIGGGPQR